MQKSERKEGQSHGRDGQANEEEGGKKREEVSLANRDDGTVEKVRPMWLAALELAFWNFGAQVSYIHSNLEWQLIDFNVCSNRCARVHYFLRH